MKKKNIQKQKGPADFSRKKLRPSYYMQYFDHLQQQYVYVVVFFCIHECNGQND